MRGKVVDQGVESGGVKKNQFGENPTGEMGGQNLLKQPGGFVIGFQETKREDPLDDVTRPIGRRIAQQPFVLNPAGEIIQAFIRMPVLKQPSSLIDHSCTLADRRGVCPLL
jgi:hypothetical protein